MSGTDALLAMSELIRLRAKASEPLDLDEMAELAAALDIPPLPLFAVIHGGRQ